MPRLFLLVLLAVTAFAAEEAVPTHLKVKATFTRPDKDGKPEVYAEPSVITVDGKQTTIRVGSAEEGVVFTVTPKVNKDGTLTLEAVTESRESLPPRPKRRRPLRAPRATYLSSMES
jgi:type II secretory pathway component GspD/PulD (secretin)